MKSLVYKSATGRTVDLYSKKMWAGMIEKLRSHEWSFDLGYRNVTGVSRPASSADIQVLSTDHALLDSARQIFDADFIAQTPGTLTVNGEWSQRCLMAKSEATRTHPEIQGVAFTALLLDGVWRKPVTQQYQPAKSAISDDLDLPADLPFDLAPMAVADKATNPMPMPLPILLRVYGPATNPYVTVAGNRYQVDATVPDGGYLTVDGVLKTIKLTDADGNVTDLFAKGHRGTGQGGGEYIFEKLPAGQSTVSWQNSFGFDLTVYLEEGEVPWSTLS